MRAKKRLCCIVTMLSLLGLRISVPAAAQTAAREPADLVVLNAKVHTVDKSQPSAEAIAVIGDRIRAVGSSAEIRAWIGPNTRVLDARGKTVLPGFIDAHVHLVEGGFDLSNVQLKDAATPEEFTRRIGAFAAKLGKGEWVLGGRWDHELWPGAHLPTREWIDGVTPENPVWVQRYDGHMGLANTMALKLAGITRDTPDPPGGTIVRDASGNPTGALKDAAVDLIDRVIPAPSEAQLTRAIRAAFAEARRLGVTGMDDISHAAEMRVYQKLLARGELTARIYALTPIEEAQAPATAGIMAGFGGDWIRTGGLKGFADGSVGSTTALFFAPYNDAPQTSGLFNAMMLPEGNMLRMAQAADKAGLQLAIHAIGDRAIHIILGVYEEIEKRRSEEHT